MYSMALKGKCIKKARLLMAMANPFYPNKAAFKNRN
jgi:hypothetical protein